jgi:biotin transport system substrate-specific component
MTTLSQTYPTLIGTLWPARTNQVLRWLVLMLAGSLFVAICAQIQVPMLPVPMTMQTFAALVIGMAFGARLGAATLALYLFWGVVGLPVFAGFASGLMNLASGGYIIGFVLAAAVVGWLAERGWDRNILTTALAMLIGNVLVYVPGLLWLATFVGTGKVLEYGLMPFLFGDLIKLVLAAVVVPMAWKVVGHPKS